MATKRRWKKAGQRRLFRYDSAEATAILFGHEDAFWWGWGVWGTVLGKEGIANTLREARRKANDVIEAIEMQVSA